MPAIARVALLAALALLPFAPVTAFPGGSDPGAGAPVAVQGTVLESMNAGTYTYVRLETPSGEVWAAGPKTAIAVGDRIGFGASATMRDFHSESLGRTFPSIEFVSRFEILSGTGAVTREEAVRGAHGGGGAVATEVAPVARVEGGLTIAEVYAGKAGLAGKAVTLRGKIVKYNSDILERNWLHVQDGSGGPGTNDLTVTTADRARVGDVVVIRGTLVLDRDFGMGYRYALIVEDATVTVE